MRLYNHEFFLSERLLDFEGETQSYLGAEKKENGRHQLSMMTADDIKHIIFLVGPEIDIIFCDKSRCWESPFADIMHNMKTPFTENTMLKSASHKDITIILVPRQRRGRNIWPATEAWRVNIGKLSSDHPVINLLTLLCAIFYHNSDFGVELALRKPREYTLHSIWPEYSNGVVKGLNPAVLTIHQATREKGAESSGEQSDRIVNDFMMAQDGIISLVQTINEFLPMTEKKYA